MASIQTIPKSIFPNTLIPPKFPPPLPTNFSLPASNWTCTSRPLIVRNSNRTDASVDSSSTSDEIRILSSSEVMSMIRLSKDTHEKTSNQRFLAMYSSVFGGFTTDSAAMVIPMDDHMVHRGHGVFDTATIKNGYLYELDQHLDRFLRSASMAKIKLPFDRERIRTTLIQTVAISKCKDASLRYWLSAGPGDFQLSPSPTSKSALYAIVIQDVSSPNYEGVKVVTSSIPIKPKVFATMKSVNYLPNVLCKLEAEEHGYFASIWLDSNGFVAEGPNMNVAFITKEKELLMPHFDNILSGCTAKRVLTLAETLVKEGKLNGISVRNVTLEEGKKADEMMLIGSGVLVRPVLQWDEQIIGDGKKGSIAQQLLELILNDMARGPPEVRVPVPYS